MNRRRPPSRFIPPPTYHPQNHGNFIPIRPTALPQCYVPQNYYYVPLSSFPSYPQYTIPNVPYPGVDCYRLVAPLGSLPPPVVGYPPYQIPAGYPPLLPALPPRPVYNNFSSARPPATSCFDQLVARSEEPRRNDINGAETSNGNNDRTRPSGGRENERNPASKKKKQRNSSRFNDGPSASQYRPRYGTNYRRRAARKDLLKSKRSTVSRSSFSANEISSIDWLTDDEYETCDDNGFGEESDWIKDSVAGEKNQPHKTSDKGDVSDKSMLDYTLITNDKSYSYVNHDPSKLRLNSEKIWIKPRIWSNQTENLQHTERKQHISEKNIFSANRIIKNNFEATCSKMTDKALVNGENVSKVTSSNNFSTENWNDMSEKSSSSRESNMPSPAKTQINIHKPSDSSESEKLGRNQLLDPGKDLWWDSSTDISCKSSAPASKPSSSEESDSHLLSPVRTSGNTKHTCSDTTVLNGNVATLQNENTANNTGSDESEKDSHVASQKLFHGVEPSNNADSDTGEMVSDSSTRNNDTDTQAAKRMQKIDPQTYLTLSCVGFKKIEKLKLCSEESDAVELWTNSNPMSLPEAERGEPADEDEAIVAVIPSDLLEANGEVTQPFKNLDLTQNNQTQRDASNSKSFAESDLHMTDKYTSLSSINVQCCSSLTSGVRSLPCSPLISEWNESEPILRSHSSSVIDGQPSNVASSTANRVCTPHAKTFTSHPFTDRTFSLCLNGDVLSKTISPCVSTAQTRPESLKNEFLLANSDASLVPKESAKVASEKPTISSLPIKESDLSHEKPGKMSEIQKSDDVIPPSADITNLKRWLQSDGQSFSKPVSSHKFNSKAKTSPIKVYQRRVLENGDCTNKSDLTRQTLHHSGEGLNHKGDSLLLRYIEKASKPETCSVDPNAFSNKTSIVPSVVGQPNATKSCSKALKTSSVEIQDKVESLELKNTLVKTTVQHFTTENALSVSADATTHTVKPTQQSTTINADLLTSKSLQTSPAVNASSFVARDGVTSNIKTRVQQLVDHSSRTNFNPIFSPCLAALQATGFNRKRCNVFPLESAFFISSSRSSKLSLNHSISLPSSPKRFSQTESLQKSISLSDVFYDSTNDDSLLFKSKGLPSSVASFTISESLSSSNNDAPLVKLKNLAKISVEETTYVSYPIPTPTSQIITLPDCEEANLCTEMNSYAGDKQESGRETDIEQEKSPVLKNVSASSSTSKDCRSQKLDKDVENELRESAKILIDSVTDTQYATNLSYADPMSDDQPLAKPPELGNSCSPSQQALPEPKKSEPKSLNQSTQTPERILTNSEKNTAEVGEATTEKLILPPKKPPRSKSPVSELEVLEDNQIGTSMSAPIKNTYVGTSSHPHKGPALFPFYPLFAVAGQSNAEPRYISPSLIPTAFSQHLIRGPCISPISWYPVRCLNNAQHPNSNNEILNNNSSHFVSASDGISVTQEFSDAHGSFQTLQLPKKPRSSSETNTSSTDDFQTPNAESFILVPCQSQPNDIIVRPCRPYISRRRSFSGIGPNAALRNRLARRNANIIMNKNPYMAKPNARASVHRLANVSHPPVKRVSRRPRFVRSSLSDETVYELVKERKGSFMTKPVIKKTLQPDTKSNAKLNLDKGTATKSGNDMENGYSSALSPEKRKNKGKVSANEKLEDQCAHSEAAGVDNRKVTEKVQVKDSKKTNKLTSLQRTLRKMIPGRKHPKQNGLEEDERMSAHKVMKRSKTDSKLISKDSEAFASRSGKLGHKHEFLGKSKKVLFHTDDESTLKAETKLSTPVSLVKVSSVGVKKVDHMLSQDTQPPFNDAYKLKDALLNRNFSSFALDDLPQSDRANNSDAGVSKSSLTDCSTATIDRNSDKCSVSTPGVRINSETGDVMNEDLARDKTGKREQKRHKTLLSSTAIDDL